MPRRNTPQAPFSLANSSSSRAASMDSSGGITTQRSRLWDCFQMSASQRL